MAIQFTCPGCNQPIEVDDPCAGQAAACPYCQRVVTVPMRSNLGVVSVPTARPLGAEPIATLPPLPRDDAGGVAAAAGRSAARTYGTYALICAILVAGLLAGMTVLGAVRLMRLLPRGQKSYSAAEIQAAQEKLFTEVAADGFFQALNLGSIFFALVGLVLAAISLRHSSRRNWRAVISGVICGVVTLLTCGGMALGLVGALAGR